MYTIYYVHLPTLAPAYLSKTALVIGAWVAHFFFFVGKGGANGKREMGKRKKKKKK